jgi:serine/threonine-protein kinase
MRTFALDALRPLVDEIPAQEPSRGSSLGPARERQAMSIQGPPALGIEPGDVLAGKYRVERVLGSGGMGVVVAAHHIQLDEKVALKFLQPYALGDAEAVARFVREARNAVKIKSEHVARVTDVGTLDNGSPYMVMEYLEGGDLAAWLRQRGAMPIGQAVEFVLQACVAVAEAHCTCRRSKCAPRKTSARARTSGHSELSSSSSSWETRPSWRSR